MAGRNTAPGECIPLARGIRFVALACVVCFGLLGNRASGQYEDRTVPSTRYFAIFADFYDGEFKDALRHFQDELRGGIKTTESRWIDSICYYTMVGECYFHMGQLDDALDHYNAALELYLAFPNWMSWVDFPPSVRPSQSITRHATPWGMGTRGTRPGQFSSKLLMMQGRINNNEVFRSGGVVQQALLFPVQVQEIVRCTSLAIRRRTELLGPLARFDPLTNNLVTALSRSPTWPNHWSQSWVDVQLGLALVASGRDTESLPVLSRACVAAGEFDHPLTATALLELGRLALLRGDYPAASGFFHEASVAAYHFPDLGIVEEAFRLGAVAHLAANRPGVFPVIEPASTWARTKGFRRLRASLLLSAAENLAVLNQTRQAAVALEQARGAIGRRTMAGGRSGARLSYLQALVFFQERNLAAGNQALAAAMAYMHHGSHWIHRIRQVDHKFTGGQVTSSGPITPRAAMELYTRVLRDPEPADWVLEPMESMAVLLTPHSESMEHWFLVALERRNHEKALEITDRARRHRFCSTLGFGGRLHSLRWILEAPSQRLDQTARLNRQDLLAAYPRYEQLSRQAQAMRVVLEATPLVPDDAELFRRFQSQLEQFGSVNDQQEAILREMAVRREAASLVFPPIKSTKEVQEGLPEGTVLMAFFVARGDLYGFLINHDHYDYWRVKAAPTLLRQLVALLRSMGHFDQNRELSVKELADRTWEPLAQGLLAHLIDGSRADLTADFPELVIVPDGLVWYVPFESLEVEVGEEGIPLIQRFRLRYSPTVSLAVPDGRGRRPAPRTAVVLGRLFPRDEESVAKRAFEDLAAVVPRCVALSKRPLPGRSRFHASLMDQLIVLDDINLGDRGPYGWAPISIESDKPGNTLDDWLALPWQGPDVVILPGFHTASENSLKRIGASASPGAEVFLTVCGLLASGTRTTLISRWRTGGQTSFDFVREFAQELPHTTPAEALQRAALLTADSQLILDREPRVKRAAVAEAPKATHPFFWSGYMLIDSGTLPDPEEPPEPEKAEADAPAAKKAEP